MSSTASSGVLIDGNRQPVEAVRITAFRRFVRCEGCAYQPTVSGRATANIISAAVPIKETRDCFMFKNSD